MKHKLSIILLLVPVLFLMAYRYTAQQGKDKKLLVYLTRILNQHYQPQTIDDEFSEKVFDVYLERTDYYKRFLIQEDVKKLRAYYHDLDDEVKAKDYEFFNLSIELINKRIDFVEGFYEEILDQPFDFEKQESFERDPEKYEYCASKDQLKEYWRKYLKYQTLSRLHNMLEVQEAAKNNNDSVIEIKTLEQLEEEARQKVRKSTKSWFRRIKRLDKDDRLATYLNSITNIYDPHTGYYPPEDKENFDISMSGQFEGIGATLQETNEGFIKVVRIVPGSASWRQGELKANDLILKVAQEDQEPVDVVNMPLDEAVKMIRGKKGTKVILTVKKLDGTITDVPIVRDVVVLDETYARSAILKDPKAKKTFGYIYLPKFYADFNNKNGGRRCAEDVKKEVAKLKKQGVDGIILDLRNNGGGSLQDAVDMAGLFIKDGPIVQIKSRFGPPYIFNDEDSRQQYDGALAVMVNSMSASASEILAAAIQDYQRGIIIGTSTFGKGTVQRFVNLDRFVPPQNADIKPLGAVKLTIQKFYRINGGATQLKGVTPDIILPDKYQELEIGEKDNEYSMPWSKIDAIQYDNYQRLDNLEKIRRKSMARVKKQDLFQLLNQQAKWLKQQREKTLYPLNLKAYRAEKETEKKQAEQYEKIEKAESSLIIEALQADQRKFAKDSTKANKMKAWRNELQHDIELEEAVFVLKDML